MNFAPRVSVLQHYHFVAVPLDLNAPSDVDRHECSFFPAPFRIVTYVDRKVGTGKESVPKRHNVKGCDD